MAPRRARGAAAAAPASVLQLPHDVLVKVLAHLELRERELGPALACRRFRDACCAAELLRDVRVQAMAAKALPAARSLLPWLVRRAAHVQRLELSLVPGKVAIADSSELSGLVTACLTTVGAQLRALELGAGTPVSHLACLPAMRSLQRLVVHSVGVLRLTAAARGLTALQHICLDGTVTLGDAACLPRGLTSLSVGWLEDDTLQQIALLPDLRRLVVGLVACPSDDDLAVLSRLTALTHLTFEDCYNIPPPSSVAALTRLQHLNINFAARDPTAQQMDAALRPLQQLTSLSICANMDGGPPALASLPQLRRVFVRRISENDVALSLPQSLRCLGVDWRIAAASMPALAAAPAQEELWISDSPEESSVLEGAWAGFWAWAAQHPPLKRVCLASDHLYKHTVCSHAAKAVLRLQRTRPALQAFLLDDCPTDFEAAYNAE